MQCPFCGQEIPENAESCPFCGERISRCASCSAVIQPDAETGASCGAQVYTEGPNQFETQETNSGPNDDSAAAAAEQAETEQADCSEEPTEGENPLEGEESAEEELPIRERRKMPIPVFIVIIVFVVVVLPVLLMFGSGTLSYVPDADAETSEETQEALAADSTGWADGKTFAGLTLQSKSSDRVPQPYTIRSQSDEGINPTRVPIIEFIQGVVQT